MTPEYIFAHISSLLKESDSNNLEREKTIGKKWNYSICATPIAVGKPLIIGINWGGGGVKDNFNYSVQQSMPTKEEFLKGYRNGEYKFLSLSQNFLKEYLKLDVNAVNFNYSNLCFFRTPSIKYLNGKDFEISIPILEQYVKEFLKPSFILSIGNTNINYLKNFIEDVKTVTTSGTSHLAYSGKLWGYDFYCVPHPNARKLSNIIRNEIWKTLFKNS